MKLHSERWADAHFWVGTFGILLYVVAMWTSGVNQGLYWRALNPDGFLKYPDFIEGLLSARFLYHMRLFGGLLYLGGFIGMIVNLALTIRAGKPVTAAQDVVVVRRPAAVPVWELMRGAPVKLSLVVVGLAALLGISSPTVSVLPLSGLVVVTVAAVLIGGMHRRERGSWHRLIEGRPLAFTLLVVLAVLAGGSRS